MYIYTSFVLIYIYNYLVYSIQLITSVKLLFLGNIFGIFCYFKFLKIILTEYILINFYFILNYFLLNSYMVLFN